MVTVELMTTTAKAIYLKSGGFVKAKSLEQI
jgi:hypothetical protein